jgi:hypothetical protein
MNKHIHQDDRKPGERCPICGDSSCPEKQASPRATAGRAAVPPWVNGLRVHISSIPHKNQRYDTCGDWFQRQDDLGQLVINVSYLPSRREMFLVAIHELIEAFLCECTGITERQVDDFDMRKYPEIAVQNAEPGDCPVAPYYKAHQFASGIERILAAEAQVDWLTYEQHIKELK